MHNGKLLIKFCCFSCKRKDLVEFQERFSALRCHHCGGPIQNPASEAALAHSMPCLDCGKIQVKSNPLQHSSANLPLTFLLYGKSRTSWFVASFNCKNWFGRGKNIFCCSLIPIGLNKSSWPTTSTKRAWRPSNLDVCQMHCRRCNPVTKLGQRQCTRIM